MHRRCRVVVLVQALSVAAIAAAAAERPAAPDGPLAQAIAAAREMAPAARYAYSRHIVVDAADERIDRVERFDPRRPAGERWHLVRENGRAPTAEDLEKYDPDAADEHAADAFEIYRELVANLRLEDAVLVSRDEDQAVYRLRETRPGFLDEETREFADKLTSRVVVALSGDTPFIRQFALHAETPFDVSLLASVDRFDMRFDYRQLAETGDIVPEQVLLDLALEALLFISVDTKTRITFGDYAALPAD